MDVFLQGLSICVLFIGILSGIATFDFDKIASAVIWFAILYGFGTIVHNIRLIATDMEELVKRDEMKRD